MIERGWRQIEFHDRSVHFFPASDNALVKARCGLYFNVKHSHEPRVNHSCEACLQAGATAR